MILQIDTQGKTVIEKFDNTARVSEHFDKEMGSRISTLLARNTKLSSVDGFLWAKVSVQKKTDDEIEKEALEQVQDFVLQMIINNLNVFDKNFTPKAIEKLILKLK